jgi:Ca-activated chloride channel family protein
MAFPTMRARVMAVLGVVLAAVAVGRAQQPFRASTDLVELPVVVTDRHGAIVRGLAAEDFEVLEDGRPQRIQVFAEGTVAASRALHLGLLLDTSESMQNDLADAMTASIQFVNAVQDSADVTLIDFDSVVRVGRFSPANYPQLFERIRSRKAAGTTALYDAVGIYLEDAMARNGQHVLVMYTDGGDSSSHLVFGKLVDLLRLSANVVVYTIGYLDGQFGPGRLQQQVRLSQMAKETGGAAFSPSSAREVAGIYRKILDEMSSRYTIGYISSNRIADGRFRKLRVNLTDPGLESAKVRSRTGYYAPRAPE